MMHTGLLIIGQRLVIEAPLLSTIHIFRYGPY